MRRLPVRVVPALALLSALVVAACGPLVQIGGGGKGPDSLLTLRAPPPPPPGPGARRTILVETPGVSGTLQTLRVPVLIADTRVQYLVRANWAEQPNKLVQHVIADTIAARPGWLALSATELDGKADRRLAGALKDFELDTRDAARPVVRVRYDAVLTGPDRALVAVRRFDRTEAVADADPSPEAVAAALNTATNALAGEVADWVSAN